MIEHLVIGGAGAVVYLIGHYVFDRVATSTTSTAPVRRELQPTPYPRQLPWQTQVKYLLAAQSLLSKLVNNGELTMELRERAATWLDDCRNDIDEQIIEKQELLQLAYELLRDVETVHRHMPLLSNDNASEVAEWLDRYQKEKVR